MSTAGNWTTSPSAVAVRCLWHKSTTSPAWLFLGAPRSSVASGAGLEPGVPRGCYGRRTDAMDIQSEDMRAFYRERR